MPNESPVLDNHIGGEAVTAEAEEALSVIDPSTGEQLTELPRSRDAGRAMRVAAALRFGQVWVDDHGPETSEMPHGGLKRSGHGNDMSIYALEEYTEIKHVAVNLSL